MPPVSPVKVALPVVGIALPVVGTPTVAAPKVPSASPSTGFPYAKCLILPVYVWVVRIGYDTDIGLRGVDHSHHHLTVINNAPLVSSHVTVVVGVVMEICSIVSLPLYEIVTVAGFTPSS